MLYGSSNCPPAAFTARCILNTPLPICMGQLLSIPLKLFRRRHNKKPPSSLAEQHSINYFAALQAANLLGRIIESLKPSIRDVMNFAVSTKPVWLALSTNVSLWRGLYLTNDPLLSQELRKRMTSEKYCVQTEVITLKRSALVESVWLRACCLLYRKPKLVLVLGGKDPVVVRRLGQPESSAKRVTLGINYHLDSYLDEDEQRFAEEFPNLFQELNSGDIIVTQDYRGAGCWTVANDPQDAWSLKLKKNGYDSAGYGILHKDIAPPTYPLFYYCDAHLGDDLDRQGIIAKQVYWYSFTELKDGALFSWSDHEAFDDLALPPDSVTANTPPAKPEFVSMEG